MESAQREKGIVTISKDTLASLPAAECPGKVVLVDKISQVPEAIEVLKKAPLLGFDTETRPSFKKGITYKVSLLQLSTPEVCYLFRTNIIGYPKPLIEILEDPGQLKVGVSIHDDFHNLKKIVDFDPAGFIDLQAFVKEFKIADNSLSRIFGILFGKRISKGQRLTNWESENLTDAQQAYAALDAFACINIYQHLKQGNFDPLKSKYLIIPEAEEEDKA